MTMKKYTKMQLLALLDSLDKAQELLKKIITTDMFEQILTLLEKMQSLAVEIGEQLEKEEGTGETVKNLEEYCELIYEITQVSAEQTGSICFKMGKLLVGVRRSISLLSTTKEIVFLPYKASMWDSLEGAYKEAMANPGNDVFVIPIPYYDKNPDGSFSEVHYEAELFPKDVELTFYDDYNLETRHPDEIYIHNPYDEYNFVTSVHPYFYASHIRDFTDKLIYIPYFVHRNNKVKEEHALMPGVIYADEVRLQSKEVAKIYHDIYVENMKQETNKFKAAASSKLHKLAAEHDIPEEWRHHIYKPDGSIRKVIFWNTHLTCVMPDKAADFFIKAREVFEIFRANDEVALLWRPHPLTITTAESMNPAALEPYLKLIEEYKAQDIGIFDDTADVHRAVDISDAYYGSSSSVEEMFKVQNKPLMRMNVTIHK